MVSFPAGGITSHTVAADVITMFSEEDVQSQLVHMQDEIIALQIKVAALEEVALSETQRAQYEQVLKEQTERMLKLRAGNTGEKPN